MPEPASLADENPIAKAYRVWSSTCPFTSRKTMIISMAATVLTMFPYDVRTALNNNVHYTLYHFEVYRLVTSVFSGAGIVSLIFGLMSFNQVGPKLERSLGSAGLMALMFTLTVCGNLLFLSFCYLLKVAGNQSHIIHASSGGIWSLIISLLAVECMATPEQPRRFWLLPVDIPSKFYPLALALIFGIMRRSFLDLLCAAAVGYAFATGRMDFLKPSRSRVAGWESGCLSNFVNSSGYIVNGAAEGQETFAIPLNNPEDHPSNRRGGGDGESSGFSLFRRGRGNEDGQGGAAGGGGGGGGGTKRESFGGSGQTLGSGRGGGGRTSMPHVGGGHSQQHDPETARRARLAALEGRGVGGDGERGAGDAEAAAPLLHPSSDGIRALQEMGFSAEEAREALQRNNGDIEAAVAYLSA